MAAKQAFGPLISAMEESETAADNLAEAWSAAESVFTAFKLSLISADFSNLIGNLDEIIKKGREVARSLDTLETNTGIRNNMLAELRAKDAGDKLIIRDKKSTPEQKKAAQNRIEARKPKLAKAAKNQYEENFDYADKLIENRLAQKGISEKTVGKKKLKEIKDRVYKSLKVENSKIGKISFNATTPMVGGNSVGYGPKVTAKRTVNVDDLLTNG